MKKTIIFISLLILTIFSVGSRTLESIPNVQEADSRRYVSDPDGFLTPQELATADAIIGAARDSSTVEIAVAVVSSIDDKDIDTAATELFRKFGLGDKAKNNGVLLLIDINNKNAVLRTGRGIEGVLPDIICKRILTEYLKPSFAEGRYGEGIINTVDAITTYVTTPEAVAELKATPEESDDDLFAFITGYIVVALVVLLVLLIIALTLFNSKKEDNRVVRYERLRKMLLPALMLSVVFLGIPLIAYFVIKKMMKQIRLTPVDCPNCKHKMRLIDEEHDNDYLTPAQDTEEKINSVDYDVWLCDNCNATEILPYVNKTTNYEVCPNCGSRAEILQSDSVLKQPTSRSEGIGQKQYYCKNCGNRRTKAYKIAKVASASAPIFIGGGFGRGGGGGSFGGGFGGGTTGGGGASTGW